MRLTIACTVITTIYLHYAKDWVAILKEDLDHDGMTVDDIAQFRKGDYSDANKDIQRYWCHVMLHFLPCVCSNYHKWDIKKNTPISVVTHATDEALVLWFLKCYIKDWDKMYEDQQQRVQDENPMNKRSRKVGKHKSVEEIGEYLKLHASIKFARNEKGNGWDEALMVEAIFQHEHVHNVTLPDSMPNAQLTNQVAKKTYVMPYSDNEDDETSLDGSATNGDTSSDLNNVAV